MTTKLLFTKQLGQFEQHAMNRDVRKVKPLIESMQKHGFLAAYPLHCGKGEDGKVVVKAGHHRLEAAKAVGCGVYYVILNDDASIVELETSSRAWSLGDYVNALVRSGNVHALAIVDYSNDTGISLGQSVSLLSGECADSCNHRHKVKDGSIEITRNWHADKVACCIKCCKSAGVKFANNAVFVGAISHLAWVAEFNMEAFCKKVRANPTMLIKCATREQYVEMIDDFYNFGTRMDNRVSLKLVAKQAAAKRAVAVNG
jgi:hypothetical protein